MTESCDRALKSAKLHAHADRPGAGGDLLSLLDFTALESHSDISGRFDQLAIALLHDYFLCVSAPSASNKSDTSMPQEFEFEILELEFYLRKEGCHEDPFAHASEEQRVAGKWFVLLNSSLSPCLLTITSTVQVLPPRAEAIGRLFAFRNLAYRLSRRHTKRA